MIDTKSREFKIGASSRDIHIMFDVVRRHVKDNEFIESLWKQWNNGLGSLSYKQTAALKKYYLNLVGT